MRTWHLLSVGVALLWVAACSSSDTVSNSASASVSQSFDFRLQDIFAGKPAPDTPMDLQAPPGDPRLFIAERGGKIVSVLEGGYALSALGRSVVTHLKVLGSL